MTYTLYGVNEIQFRSKIFSYSNLRLFFCLANSFQELCNVIAYIDDFSLTIELDLVFDVKKLDG